MMSVCSRSHVHAFRKSAVKRARMSTITSFIHGKYIPLESSKNIFNSINPATGDILATVQEADSTDLEDAVNSAEIGFSQWKRFSGAERGRVLRKAADMLRDPATVADLAHIESQDCGKPLSETESVDIPSVADTLEYFGGIASTLQGSFYSDFPRGQSQDVGSYTSDETDRINTFAYTRREPLGVCGGIGAWNYPMQIASWKSAPCLAAGNAMVLKPSENTPVTAGRLAEVLCAAGAPPGVFNVVQGRGTLGNLLSAHPRIAKVSFTGGVETGRKVMAAAAATTKQVTLELGGKSPLLIFDDADVKQAVRGAMMGNFYTQGEICTNGTRVFVQRGVYEQVVAEVLRQTGQITVGDPLLPATQVGALISEEHADKVVGFVQRAVAEGAVLQCGGQRVVPPPAPPVALSGSGGLNGASSNGDCSGGAYVSPAVLTGLRDDMEVVQQEIFGPVMCLLPFDTEAEGVARANATPFGLAAAVFTSSLQRAHRVTAALEAGTTWVNTYNLAPPELPFGGFKASGLGKENSMEALLSYTRLKSVYIEMGDVDTIFE